ncbi:MAG: U32 family peptidase C-terminal domain-containing protein, partial [Erysipelotrichales bacterium]
ELTLLSPKDSLFTMSSKDLCLAHSIPDLIEMGVSSLKIEGRMKSIYYLATIVSTYRAIIDDYLENPASFAYDDKYTSYLAKAANRLVSSGFYDEAMDHNKQLYNARNEHPTKEFIGYVKGYDKDKHYIELEQRNYFAIGDEVELFSPNKDEYRFKVEKIFDEDYNELDVARHPQQKIFIPFDHEIQEHSMLRKVIE